MSPPPPFAFPLAATAAAAAAFGFRIDAEDHHLFSPPRRDPQQNVPAAAESPGAGLWRPLNPFSSLSWWCAGGPSSRSTPTTLSLFFARARKNEHPERERKRERESHRVTSRRDGGSMKAPLYCIWPAPATNFPLRHWRRPPALARTRERAAGASRGSLCYSHDWFALVLARPAGLLHRAVANTYYFFFLLPAPLSTFHLTCFII